MALIAAIDGTNRYMPHCSSAKALGRTSGTGSLEAPSLKQKMRGPSWGGTPMIGSLCQEAMPVELPPFTQRWITSYCSAMLAL